MTEIRYVTPAFEHELARRYVIEDPTVDHDTEIGQVVDLDHDVTNVLDAMRIANTARNDRLRAIVPTAIARHDLKLVLDEAAVISKFPQEENQ